MRNNMIFFLLFVFWRGKYGNENIVFYKLSIWGILFVGLFGLFFF